MRTKASDKSKYTADFTQPYLPNGKKNPRYERIYGKGAIERITKTMQGKIESKQDSHVKEMEERNSYKKTKFILT